MRAIAPPFRTVELAMPALQPGSAGFDVRRAKGVLPPPGSAIATRELDLVRHVAANRDPVSDQWAHLLNSRGDREMWFDFAKQYRQRVGLARGWTGTGMMAAAMALAYLRTDAAKREYPRPRPFDVDPSIVPLGSPPRSSSYPSGHAASSAAAATVLGALWPARAPEFQHLANHVALSRVYSGVHFPTDVIVGSRVGRKAALQLLEPLL